MKQKMKSSKGITLIALVITIIVLLILAAVSIATLTGENGILTKATTAKDNTQKEEEKEQMRLAYATALANNSNNLKVSAEEFIQELKKLTTIENLESLSYPLTVTFTETGNKYEITEKGEIIESGKGAVTPEPEDEEKTLASKITANNYGDFVDYGIDLNGNSNTKDDWKIFYSENGRVFLIAADYLDYTKSGNKINFTNTKLQKVFENQGGKYSLNWNNDHLPDMQTTGIQKEIFKATMYDVTTAEHNNNPNAKCVSTLLNTNNWTNFVNQYSDKAIGSPTLEMWVKSWNAKEYTNLNVTADAFGYKINGDSSIDLSSSKYDELYFPYQKGVNNGTFDNGTFGTKDFETFGYWLASPSSYDNSTLVGVNVDDRSCSQRGLCRYGSCMSSNSFFNL